MSLLTIILIGTNYLLKMFRVLSVADMFYILASNLVELKMDIVPFCSLTRQLAANH